MAPQQKMSCKGMEASRLAHGFDKAVVAAGNAVLMQKHKPPNTILREFMDFCKSHSIGYEERVDPELMLVHGANRAEFMLNHNDCHERGDAIVDAGVKQPVGGMAYEICPIIGDPLREFHLRRNAEIIERSGGMLAPISGKERFLTIATSNCGQFGKAAKAGCTTNQPNLADKSGNLSVSYLTNKDQGFTEYFKGWNIFVLPWTAELAWPMGPHIFQQAQNSDNAVGKSMGELETAICIFKHQSQGMTWKEAGEKARATSTVKTSIPALVSLCEYFGQADGASLVYKLESFQKALGVTTKIGEEMIAVVVALKFADPTMTFPFIRLAILATNLTAPQVKDGCGRLLNTSDASACAGQHEKAKALEYEQAFKQLDAWLQTVIDAGGLKATEANDIFFAFLVQSMLLWRGKQGKGFSQRSFKDHTEVKGEAALSISSKLRKGAKNPCTWTAAKPPSASADSARPTLATLSDLNDPCTIAGDKGYTVGTVILEKGCDARNSLYTITKVTDNGVNITQRTLGLSAPFSTFVNFGPLFKDWLTIKKTDGLPRAMPDACNTRRLQSGHKEKVDLAKAWLSVGLYEAPSCNDDSFKFLVNPKRLLATKDYGANELTLIPRSYVQHFAAEPKNEASYGVAPCTSCDVTVHISAPMTATSENAAEWKTDVVFEPFWWVQSTPREEKANVKLFDNELQEGLTVAVYKNHKPITANEEILVYVPTTKKLAVREYAEQITEPPSKRMRRKGPAPSTVA